MKYLFLLGCSFALSAPALAQDVPVEDPGQEECCEPHFLPVTPEFRIEVVASGQRQKLGDSGHSISVLDARELAQVQGSDLTRSLARLPGVTLSRNGGQGGFTGVRVRGSDAEQVLVLIDGVRVADVAAPGGGFDFGNLSAGNIDKIELLRGSNSVAWGSQAVGGIIAISTADLDGASGAIEYGAHDSLFASAAAGFKRGNSGATLGVSFHNSDGISSAAGGTETDGFRQWQLTGKGKLAIGDGLTLRANARYASGRLEIDGFPAPAYTFADTAEYQETREGSGRIGADFTSDRIGLSAGLTLSDTRRALFDPAFGSASNYTTKGHSERAELRGQWRLLEDFRLDFGGEREWSRFSSTFDAEKRARQDALHALLGFDNGPANFSGGLRYEHHDRFGDAWIAGANGSIEFGDDWRLRASFGEGFKSPTLFQLHSDFGNAGLHPERSTSFDVGVEKLDRYWGSHFALTLFRRDSDDLIDFVSCFGVTTGLCAGRPFGTYDNVGRARAEGFELEGDVRPVTGVQLRAAYSYVKAVNRDSGRDLARRPRHALSLSADVEVDPSHVFSTALGADVRLVSDSFDDAANRVRLDGHALLTLRISRPILLLDQSSQRTLDLYARVENVTNARYQTAAGYGTYGRSAYAGVRMKW